MKLFKHQKGEIILAIILAVSFWFVASMYANEEFRNDVDCTLGADTCQEDEAAE